MIKIIIIFSGLVIFSFSCRSREKDSSNKSAPEPTTNSNKSISDPVIELRSIASENLHSSIPETSMTDEDKKVEPIPAVEGGVVLGNEVLSAGDKYLLNIAQGRKSVHELTEKEVALIEFEPIRSEIKLMKSPRREVEVSDIDHAYARVIDLGISLVSEIVCLGIYEDESESGYFIFYGIRGKPLSDYLLAYYVNKTDGQVAVYRRRL